jgi:hypothetical protein
VTSAEHDIATWPGFEPWRIVPARQLRAEIESDAQTKIEPISITSTVQMSGAK